MPSQDDLDEFYGSSQYWHEPGGNPYQIAHEDHQARIRVATVVPYMERDRKHRVLDIGAGHGCLVHWLNEKSTPAVDSYFFVEPDDANASRISARRAGFSIVRANSAKQVEPGSIDLLFLNHVVEHVASPREFLLDAMHTLRPGGIAYIETPHRDYQFKADVFPHLHFFTSDSVRALVDPRSAELLSCDTFGAWPGLPAGISTLAHRVYARLFRICVDIGWRGACHWIDHNIWRYDSLADGIWIRWMLRKR